MKRLFAPMAVAVMLSLGACHQGRQNGGPQAATAAKTDSTAAPADSQESALEFPPLMAFVVKGAPLFVPFNDGDLPDQGRSLRQSPEGYALFLLGDEAFDVSFAKEKNKELKEDESSINQYLYKEADKMKGMTYDFARADDVKKYMDTHGDMLPEGDIVPMEMAEGVLVGRDYMKQHVLLNVQPTTTEDPDGPTFPEAVVRKVEKMIGMKVETGRVSAVFGKAEYEFGVMTTAKKGNMALGIYVLTKGSDVSISVDTLRANVEDGNIDWSMADPDSYMEPSVSVVAKSDAGLEIFCSVPDEETTEYLLLRQKGDRLKRERMGAFLLRYE